MKARKVIKLLAGAVGAGTLYQAATCVTEESTKRVNEPVEQEMGPPSDLGFVPKSQWMGSQGHTMRAVKPMKLRDA
jgi:hypothetical protein